MYQKRDNNFDFVSEQTWANRGKNAKQVPP